MKFLSLNIDNFGNYSNPTRENANRIREYILEMIPGPDVVILQEFKKSCVGDEFLTKLEKDGYVVKYPKHPNGKSTCENDVKAQSIVVALISKELKNCEIINPILESQSKMWPRWIGINISDLSIVGVHIPSGVSRPKEAEKYWNDICNYSKKMIDKKAMLIGDMNVYDPGTVSSEKFNELLSPSAIVDAWKEKKNTTNRPTCDSGKRIDYALMTQLLYKDLTNIDIDDTLRIKKNTDHSALIVEFR